MTTPVPLGVGDQAWAIVCDKETGAKGRRTILGAARVEIVAVAGDRFDVRVIRGGGGVHAGHVYRQQRRCDLFATFGAEHVAFGEQLAKLYAPRSSLHPERAPR